MLEVSDKQIDTVLVKQALQRLSLKQLHVLNYMSNTSGPTVTNMSAGLAEQINLGETEGLGRKQALGGLLASLSKVRIQNEPLIEPRGKTPEGLRWQINKNISNVPVFGKTIKDILELE